MRHLANFLLLFGLVGCVAGPDYTRPDLPVASDFKAKGGSEPISSQWWLAYGDPRLNQLQLEALSKNLSIEAALARVDQARATLREQGASIRPNLNAEGSIGRAVQSKNSGVGILSRIIPDYPRTITDVSVGFGSTWDLDLAGGHKRRGEIVRAELAQSEWGVAAARVAVSADLADAYWGLRGAQIRQALYARLVALAERQNKIIVGRWQLGAASEQEVVSSEADLVQLRAGQPLIDADVGRYENTIAALLGKSASQLIPWPPESFEFAEVPNPEAGLPADLVSRRPDVIIAEQRLIAANAGVGLAVSEYYPKLSLSGLFGIRGARLGDVGRADSITAFGGVGLRWRLFDFGRIDAEVARAKGRTREALAEYRQVALAASTEVEQCFVTLNGARQAIAFMNDAMKRATRDVEIEERAVSFGGRSLQSLLNHQRQHAEIEIQLLNARETGLRASVACYRALGVVP